MAHTLKDNSPASNAHVSRRYLIIRFSSLGDVGQCLPVADLFKARDPQCHISWLVRADLKGLLELSPSIDRILPFSRAMGFSGLVQLAWQLSAEPLTHVYDAHNNVRSHILLFFLRSFWLIRLKWPFAFIRRGKDRFQRFLFFQLGLSTIPQPFRGMLSFLTPLKPWIGDLRELPTPPTIPSSPQNVIVLAPSASCELKRWPKEYFERLILLLPQQKFILVGGPNDTFIAEIRKVAPDRVTDCAGKLNWRETGQLVADARLTISNDTGVVHIADWLAKPALALRGAAAFGHTTRSSSLILEAKLPCQPCSKDGLKPCKNAVFKKCLLDVTPERVAQMARELLS